MCIVSHPYWFSMHENLLMVGRLGFFLGKSTLHYLKEVKS